MDKTSTTKGVMDKDCKLFRECSCSCQKEGIFGLAGDGERSEVEWNVKLMCLSHMVVDFWTPDSLLAVVVFIIITTMLVRCVVR